MYARRKVGRNMIKRVDIKKMGSFTNFLWTASVGKDAGNSPIELKKVNIFYGRNYSGKTTFSRVVRCLETKVLPDKFDDADFTLYTDAGNVTVATLAANPHEVRVYNRDFVDKNLAFLRDAEGHILPFAVIGEQNNEVQAEITKKEGSLGSVENSSGLRFALSEKRKKAQELSRDAAAKEKALGTKLTAKATNPPTGIKHQTIYKDPNYNTPKLKADIATVIEKSVSALAEDVRAAKIALLGESPLPDILVDLSFSPTLGALASSTQALLQKKIKPQQAITELLDDPELQAWVRTGVELHEGKRQSCGFCGSNFKDNFWANLRAHFDKESQQLLSEIETLAKEIAAERARAEEVEQKDLGAFYADLKVDAQSKIQLLSSELKAYKAQLDALTRSLKKKEADVFNSVAMPAIKDCSSSLTSLLGSLGDLIKSNNSRTQTLATDQAATLLELRLSEVAQFMADIGYKAEEGLVEKAELDARAANEDLASAAAEVQKLEQELDDLRKKLRDEKRGAEKVNQYLRNFFGHDGLKLVAIESGDSKEFTFTVMRSEAQAFNLSEGECSLVSFCYFMARLEDVTASGKSLIVYIDDPISSLDSNHIFFVYSLVHSAMERANAAGNAWKQVFISTHNLDFLKMLKRLPEGRSKQHSAHFMITATKGGSAITPMPVYLRNYVTEFNFLFEQICLCSTSATTPEEHNCFYNFGNNMRKFLEAYLFFKYPFATLNPDADNDTRIAKFFGDGQSDAMVQRIINEYSHLQGAFDRGMQPIDRSEIAKVADFVLAKIKEKDPDQYQSLLMSVGLVDPLVTTQPAIQLTTAASA
jgi:wobble nucleotide-excising tRNase